MKNKLRKLLEKYTPFSEFMNLSKKIQNTHAQTLKLNLHLSLGLKESKLKICIEINWINNGANGF